MRQKVDFIQLAMTSSEVGLQRSSKALPTGKLAATTTTTTKLASQLPLLQASLQLFAGKMILQPAGGKKCFPRFHWVLKHRVYATEINVFLIGKNVLTIMAPILINKDMFEPSYNDFRFMVQNHCYFCWNTRFNVTCFPNSLFLYVCATFKGKDTDFCFVFSKCLIPPYWAVDIKQQPT